MNIKRILIRIGIILFQTLKLLCTLCGRIYKSIRKNVLEQNYGGIYRGFSIALLIFTTLTAQKGSLFITGINAIISISSIVVLVYILFHIISHKDDDIVIYYKNMRNWCIATFLLIMLGSTLFIQKIPDYLLVITQCIIALSLLACIYFFVIYFYLRHVTTYSRYFILFILSPLIALLLWGVVAMLASDIFKTSFLGEDKIAKWCVMILAILLINFSVKFTPYDRLVEVKVAIYLILAVSSAVSSCYFISDYITSSLMQMKEISTFYTYEEIKGWIDNKIQWYILPYLIGSVFGCFSVELADRNNKLNEIKKQDRIRNGDTA